MEYSLDNMLTATMPLGDWCAESKRKRLYELVIESDSKLSIDAGVFLGQSTISMAFAHAHKGSGHIVGIDAWKVQVAIEGSNSPENNQWWSKLDMDVVQQTFLDTIKKHNLGEYCQALKAKTYEAYRYFDDESIDIFHQDSNHSSEIILRELGVWINKLKIGAKWIIDDANWSEAKEGYSHLPEFGLELYEDHISWQIHKRIK